MLLLIVRLGNEVSGEVAAQVDFQSLGDGHRVSAVWRMMFRSETSNSIYCVS